MSQVLVFFGDTGIAFLSFGSGKKGVGVEHPVPLQEAGAAAGSNPEGLFHISAPRVCSPTLHILAFKGWMNGKLLWSVPVSIPEGCTWLQPPKSPPAPGRGAQGWFGVRGSRATPLTVLAFLCPHRKRRGAINSKQLTYLEKYRPKQRLRFKDPHNHKNKCCIM